MGGVGLTLELLPGAAEVLARHADELPQKDELCGAFCATLALRAAGVAQGEARPLDQDAVAVAAGSVLSTGSHSESLPPGETGRRDYRATLATIEDESRSGTTPEGIVRAVSQLSGDELAAVPLAGPWSVETVAHVLGLVSLEGVTGLIANVATRRFWGARPSPAELFGYLASGGGEGPPPDWDVGHFVCVLGALRGPGGTLVLIADTYPTLGWRGLHVQPIERMAAALERSGMAPGGVLVVVTAEQAGAVRDAASSAGLAIGVWDNGTIDLAHDGTSGRA